MRVTKAIGEDTWGDQARAGSGHSQVSVMNTVEHDSHINAVLREAKQISGRELQVPPLLTYLQLQLILLLITAASRWQELRNVSATVTGRSPPMKTHRRTPAGGLLCTEVSAGSCLGAAPP